MVLNEHQSLMVGPTKAIRVLNKDKPWFNDQCRRALGLKYLAHLRLLVGQVGGWTGVRVVGKANLLTGHFDSMQSRESVDQPPTCHPSLVVSLCLLVE